eukprot:104247-Chlamydomonas_euryale.AAC.1
MRVSNKLPSCVMHNVDARELVQPSLSPPLSPHIPFGVMHLRGAMGLRNPPPAPLFPSPAQVSLPRESRLAAAAPSAAPEELALLPEEIASDVSDLAWAFARAGHYHAGAFAALCGAAATVASAFSAPKLGQLCWAVQR